LLERVAGDHPDVLDEPAPLIVFDQFADSSLNFTIRAFVGSTDKRLSVTHELHTRIDEAFRQAGIEIAFPQRDLHLRTIPNAWKVGVDRPAVNGENLDS
jgi:potassium efflux system protein